MLHYPQMAKSPPPSNWAQKVSSRLQETRPDLFKSLKTSGKLQSHLKELTQSVESLYSSQKSHLLTKGATPEQADWEAEHLAMDTYLQSPGAES